MAPVLYKCDASAPSRGVLISIDLLQIADKLEYVDVNPHVGDTRTPEYLKMNPQHTSPTLKTDDIIICDSHVIMTYLTSKYAPESDLYPKDLNGRCMVDQGLYFESTRMTPKIILAVETTKSGLDLSEDQKDVVRETYSFLDKFLEKTKFVAADHLTLADASISAALAPLSWLIPIPKEYKNLNNWYARINEIPAFKKYNDIGVSTFSNFITSLRNNK